MRKQTIHPTLEGSAIMSKGTRSQSVAITLTRRLRRIMDCSVHRKGFVLERVQFADQIQLVLKVSELSPFSTLRFELVTDLVYS